MRPHLFSYLFFVLCCFQSCTKAVDFDQIDNAQIKANYIITQVFFNLEAPDFLNDFGEELNFQSNLIETGISGGTDKYLEKIVFTVETKNEFSRTFNVTINLFDASKNLIYTLNPTVVIPPNSGALTTEIEIPKEDVGLVINAQYIEFSLAMSSSSDGSIISPSDPSVLNFKSYVELFLNYTTTQ